MAICLLPVGIGSGASAHSHAVAALDGALEAAMADPGGCAYRLGGDQIPVGRVIAVCDAFTAMTSPRPYAAQLTIPEAVAELRLAAGSQFDPAVVEVLSELVVELVWPTGPAREDPDRIDTSHHRA